MKHENEILKDLGHQARDELAETDLPSDLKGFDASVAERILRRLAEDAFAVNEVSPSSTGGDSGGGAVKNNVQARFAILFRRAKAQRLTSGPRLLACGTGVALAASLALVLLGEVSPSAYKFSADAGPILSSPGISTEEPCSKLVVVSPSTPGAGTTSGGASSNHPSWSLELAVPRDVPITIFGDDEPRVHKRGRSDDQPPLRSFSPHPASSEVVRQTVPKPARSAGKDVPQPASIAIVDRAPDGGRPLIQLEASSVAQSSSSLVASSVGSVKGTSVEAQTLFDEARKLMSAGHCPEARVLLETSQKLDPAIGTLLNLAYCEEKEGRLASASMHYGEAQRMARAADFKKGEALARERAVLLAARLSKVTIEVEGAEDTPGLRISLDGANIDHESWSIPIPADAGMHTLKAMAPGKKNWETTVQVAADASIAHVRVPILEDDAAVVRAPTNGLADHSDRRR